ncbi:PAS domain-containing sensor histidine kinase [Candidatus Zixiibacteriota bacterium]
MQNRVTHGRRIKTLFIVLAAMLLVSHLSSILLFNGVLHTEEQKVRSRLGGAVEGILQVWAAGGCRLESADTLVDQLLRSQAVVAIWMARYDEQTGWRSRRFGRPGVLVPVLGPATGTGVGQRGAAGRTPFTNAEFHVGDHLYRAVSATRMIDGVPVVTGAAAPIPTVARLRGIRQWDFFLRAGILILFVWFALQFFRLIFVPYQKMRAEAERLSGTECLAGPKSDDVEYVMEAFAAALTRLTRQKDDLQQEYDQSKKRYENLEKFNTYILNSMSAGVLIFNRRGIVLRLNPSAGKILGLESTDIVGQSYRELGKRFPELGNVLVAGLENSQIFVRREITISLDKDRDGRRYLGITTSLILDDWDRVVGISVLLTDLTEIKQLQSDLENNRRLADLGEMAAGLAHQLRNSMAAVVGFGKLLRDKVSSDDSAVRTVNDVLQEAAESEQMLEQFLNFARPLYLERGSVSLTGIVDRAIDTVNSDLEKRQIKVMVFSPPGDDLADVDSLLLRQVFVNLFQNAAEAMGQRGKLEIRLFPPVNDGKPGGHWQIRVGDTGPGIPGTDHEKIFQPFFSSKETGTGLGLAIARKIMLCHGGYLSVESSTPGGTVFLLRLPPKGLPAPDEELTLAARAD